MEKLKWIKRGDIHHYGYINKKRILVCLFMVFGKFLTGKNKFRLSIHGSNFYFDKLKDAKKVGEAIHNG